MHLLVTSSKRAAMRGGNSRKCPTKCVCCAAAGVIELLSKSAHSVRRNPIRHGKAATVAQFDTGSTKALPFKSNRKRQCARQTSHGQEKRENIRQHAELQLRDSRAQRNATLTDNVTVHDYKHIDAKEKAHRRRQAHWRRHEMQQNQANQQELNTPPERRAQAEA
jgi:hypothetical protein